MSNEIVCYYTRFQFHGMRFNCYAMRFQYYVLVYVVKDILELTVNDKSLAEK